MDIQTQNDALKEVVKAAFLELLIEKRELMQEIIVEALEDHALGSAIKEGAQNDLVSRSEIFEVLNK
ncbi:MAG: hypothetical protein AB8F95_16285 [Bacteroidia bacterium]